MYYVIDTSANVVISKSNEVFLKIDTEPHIEYELRDHFTFEVEGAKFMPQYRNRTVSYTHLTLPTKA